MVEQQISMSLKAIDSGNISQDNQISMDVVNKDILLDTSKLSYYEKVLFEICEVLHDKPHISNKLKKHSKKLNILSYERELLINASKMVNINRGVFWENFYNIT